MATRLIITGQVQGVGYRESMRREAQRLGVSGWVRNQRDGSVTALVDGAPADVRALIEWAQRGPRAARVSGVKATGVEADENLTGFEIRAAE